MRNQLRNGRPGVNAQLQLKSTLRQYFEDNINAQYTSEKTGINIKTVCKYFNRWSEDIEETESTNFLERQKRNRIQIINSYDSQIDETREFLTHVNLEIENYNKEKKSIPKHLLTFKLEIMKFKSSLVEKKTAFLMQPTIDESMEKIIADKMEKHDNTRQGS